jgi:hypothetical protein
VAGGAAVLVERIKARIIAARYGETGAAGRATTLIVFFGGQVAALAAAFAMLNGTPRFCPSQLDPSPPRRLHGQYDRFLDKRIADLEAQLTERADT